MPHISMGRLRYEVSFVNPSFEVSSEYMFSSCFMKYRVALGNDNVTVALKRSECNIIVCKDHRMNID